MQYTYLQKNDFFSVLKLPNLKVLIIKPTDTALEDTLKEIRPEGLASLRAKEFIL